MPSWYHPGHFTPHPFSLTIDGVEFIPAVVAKGQSVGVPLDSISITEVGGNAQSTMTFLIEDVARAFQIPAFAFVRFKETTGGDDHLFSGYIIGRRTVPMPGNQGTGVEVRCVDASALLDMTVVPKLKHKAGASDQALIQSVVAHSIRHHSIFTHSGLCTLTNASMEAIDIENSTLRAAIEAIAQQAGDGRSYYVDFLGRLHYWTGYLETGMGSAPSVVTDTMPAPVAVATTVATDNMGRYPGTYVGGPTLNAAGPIGTDYAVTLNGTTQYVQTPIPTTFGAGTGSWTIAGWINHTPDANVRRLFSSESAANRNGIYAVSYSTYLGFARCDGTGADTTNTPTLSAGWHFVVGTYDGQNIRTYVDGAVPSGTPTKASTRSIAPANTIRIGTGGWIVGSGFTFNGSMDEWMFLDGTALSAAQVADLYAARSSTATWSTAAAGLSLTAFYRFGDFPYTWTYPAVTVPENLQIEYDDSQIINAVYVVGGKRSATGWVKDETSIKRYGLHQAVFEAPHAKTAAARDAVGRHYINRHKDPVVRGSFELTDRSRRWHVGQTVTITNQAVGLSGATYPIRQIDTEFLGGDGIRRRTIHFGDLPASGRRRGRTLPLPPGGPSDGSAPRDASRTGGSVGYSDGSIL